MWNGALGRQHLVGAGEDSGKRRRLREAAVGDRVQMREVEHRADPARARRDREHVLRGAELAHASHDLDAERHRAVLLLQPLTQLAQLLDDGVDRGLALAAEQEARVEDDDLGPGRLRDAGGVVEHPDGHVQLLAALGVTHEAGDRRVDREDDAGLAGQLAEALGPRVVHPELPLEVDLAGREAALLEELDRLLGALARRDAGRAVVELRRPRKPR